MQHAAHLALAAVQQYNESLLIFAVLALHTLLTCYNAYALHQHWQRHQRFSAARPSSAAS
jgi:hypothetical protein